MIPMGKYWVTMPDAKNVEAQLNASLEFAVGRDSDDNVAYVRLAKVVVHLGDIRERNELYLTPDQALELAAQLRKKFP